MSFIEGKIRNALIKRDRYNWYKFFSGKFIEKLNELGFENKKAKGEDEYIKKWRALSPRVEPYSYRLYSHYCGFTPNIVPEDIGRTLIEPVLCPLKHRPAYSDKNLFPMIIGKEFVPTTVVCRIGGSTLLDKDFKKADKELTHYIGETTPLILKPTLYSNSGMRILKFEKKGDSFVSTDGTKVLTKEFLMSYGRNFCLQKAIEQHPFMSQFCASSVNTIRLCVYRSVKDNQLIVTGGFFRIGKEGAVVDNAGSGGAFIGLDITTGKFANYLIEPHFNKLSEWNGIDFSHNTFVMPYWDKVIEFAKFVGSRILHHRLIALDIAIDPNGKPILIEFNVEFFGYFAYMLSNQEVFGKYTDEVIDYCKMMM
ncbi:MAG: hexapeptide transferase [Bacteroidaceae bacterium]|nr:hexapeptide transferase [Bacteroidaceae bacterium]